MQRDTLPKAIALLCLAALLAACATPPPVPQEISLLALDMYWDVERIETQVNQPLRLTLRNEGILDHNFEILELDVSVFLSPGETQVVEFVIDRSGIFHYICSIPGHEEAGMLGEIVAGD